MDALSDGGSPSLTAPSLSRGKRRSSTHGPTGSLARETESVSGKEKKRPAKQGITQQG